MHLKNSYCGKDSLIGAITVKAPAERGARKERTVDSREKGKRGELELANLLKRYGFNTRRGQQYCGANGDADIVGLPGIHIECKRVERLNISEAMKQSRSDAKKGEVPVVIHRKNTERWLVTLDLNEFMSMYIGTLGKEAPSGNNSGAKSASNT